MVAAHSSNEGTEISNNGSSLSWAFSRMRHTTTRPVIVPHGDQQHIIMIWPVTSM